MIPIDHGLSFPDYIDICVEEIIWMNWPQTKEPFSQTELDFIDSINIDADINIIKLNLKFR